MDRTCWDLDHREEKGRGGEGNTLRVLQTLSALLAGEYNHNFSDDGYFEYATVAVSKQDF
jgi:hypothetical protein